MGTFDLKEFAAVALYDGERLDTDRHPGDLRYYGTVSIRSWAQSGDDDRDGVQEFDHLAYDLCQTEDVSLLPVAGCGGDDAAAALMEWGP